MTDTVNKYTIFFISKSRIVKKDSVFEISGLWLPDDFWYTGGTEI